MRYGMQALGTYDDKNWSIFTALHDSMMEKAIRKLGCSKCPECGKVTFYTLKSLGDSLLQCKNCKIDLNVESPLTERSGGTPI